MVFTSLGAAVFTLCVNFIEVLKHKDNGLNFPRCRRLYFVYQFN